MVQYTHTLAVPGRCTPLPYFSPSSPSPSSTVIFPSTPSPLLPLSLRVSCLMLGELIPNLLILQSMDLTVVLLLTVSHIIYLVLYYIYLVLAHNNYNYTAHIRPMTSVLPTSGLSHSNSHLHNVRRAMNSFDTFR